MLLGYTKYFLGIGGPGYPTWGGTGGGPTTYGDPHLIYDGRPGTGCTVNWSSNPALGVNGYCAVGVNGVTPYELDNTNTFPAGWGRWVRTMGVIVGGLPIGTRVDFRNASTVIGTTKLTRLPGGRIGAWLTLDSPVNLTTGALSARFYNDVNGAATIADGTLVTLYEFFFQNTVDISVSTIVETIVDPTRINRSSGNQPWAVMRKPFRKITVTVSPKTTQQYLTSGLLADYNASLGFATPPPLQDVILAMSQCASVIVVPLWHSRATPASPLTIDQSLLYRTAMLARCTNIAPFDGTLPGYWAGQLEFEELL